MRIFRGRAAAAPPGVRKVAAGINFLARYAILGAVALSILPTSARAGFHLQAAQTQDQTGDQVSPPAETHARPLFELLSAVKQLEADGAIDLSSVLALTIEADRNDDGTIGNVAITGAPLDNAILQRLAEDVTEALSDSRVLVLLERARHLSMDFRLDATTLAANLATEIESDTLASQLAHDLLIGYARLSNHRRNDAAPVFNNMQTSASGKILALRLEMSREAAGNLLSSHITPD